MPRHATLHDVPSVAELYHSVWHETHAAFMPTEEVACRTISFFVERMSGLLQSTLVEERSGLIVGFSAWQGNFLGQIYVASPFRGSTLASGLLSASEHEMAREGTFIAELHCLSGNERARRFYERLGWQHAGNVVESVVGPDGHTDIVFWRMCKLLA